MLRQKVLEKLVWKPWMGKAIIGLSIFCALALLALEFTKFGDMDISDWGKPILFVVSLLGALAALVLAISKVSKEKSKSYRFSMASSAVLIVGINSALGTMTDALSIFSPQKDDNSEIKKDLAEISKDVKALKPGAGVSARIAQEIVGIWGEPGCAVTYRFSMDENALLIDSDKRPPGSDAWNFVGTITNAIGDDMEVRGEQPAKAKGMAASFSIEKSGPVKRLTWDDRVRDVPLKLDWCEEL